MGYVLFTASGTFKPSSYGLVQGDALNVVCVGGGASGTAYAGSWYTGGSGTASSFGSFVTAAGGVQHSAATIVAPQAFGRAGMKTSGIAYAFDNGYTRTCGAAGAPGWMPGLGYVPYPVPMLRASIPASGYALVSAYFAGDTGPQVEINTNNSALCNSGACYGGCGCWSPIGPYVQGPCPGGYGYGAGGGGNCHVSACGGNSGSIVEASVILTSTASINITVGTGGSRTSYTGAGAPGCVAVFW